MFSNLIGVDLGTTNTLIYTKKNGIVLRESSVVAIKNDSSKSVILAGDAAKQMEGKTPKNIFITNPLKYGVISDIDIAPRMLKYFIKKVFKRILLRKLEIAICYRPGITPFEKIAIEETAYRAGANKVYLIPRPLAAAIGAGLPVYKPVGNIIVDIGGGTTDIAIVSSGDIVISKSLYSAGNEMDQEIISYIRRKYKLVIGENTAEQIKIQICSAFSEETGETEKTIEIEGKDLISGFPKLQIIKSREVNKALKNSIITIINAIKAIIELAPPELSHDIMNNGIMLAGGGSLLNGFDKLLRKVTNLPVNIADNPLDCVAIGAGKALESINNLKLSNSLVELKKPEYKVASL